MCKKIQAELFALQDIEYKKFHSKLIPNIDSKTIIGVRVPLLRKLAKTLKNSAESDEFLKILPHTYYEENNLHALLLEQLTDYNHCVEAVDAFLPYVDNWATCDILRPKCFAKHRRELLNEIERWISSDRTYTVRFAIEMLMVHYLDADFAPCYPQMVAQVQSDEYYINMMIAWYFATALAKQWDSIIPYLTEYRLSPWVHNKTIQKAIESYRITPEQKAYLKTLRIKNSHSELK